MNDAQRITVALRGHWFGHYGLCFCPAHPNAQTPSLSVRVADNGRLLAYCHAGCDFQAVIEGLRSRGLLDGSSGFTLPTGADLTRIRTSESEKAAKQEIFAQMVWRETLPIHGTVAETYLRGRRITCDAPHTLRFHPNCWHPTGRRYPAMIGIIEGAERQAVHRTFLRADGSGKADVDPSRAMLGGCSGGAVRLGTGEGKLVVTEGIETGLSLASGILRYPATIWAALSTSGVRSLRLPCQPGELVLASDGDIPGRESAMALARRANAAGWTVRLLPAPDDRDWNDVLVGNIERERST